MKTKKYKLICMSFDGSYVTDSIHDSIEDAQKTLDNFGSKWYFYPWPLIIDNDTLKIKYALGIILDTNKNIPILGKMFKGKSLITIQKAFKKTFNYIQKNKINGDALKFEYILIYLNSKFLKN